MLKWIEIKFSAILPKISPGYYYETLLSVLKNQPCDVIKMSNERRSEKENS